MKTEINLIILLFLFFLYSSKILANGNFEDLNQNSDLYAVFRDVIEMQDKDAISIALRENGFTCALGQKKSTGELRCVYYGCNINGRFQKQYHLIFVSMPLPISTAREELAKLIYRAHGKNRSVLFNSVGITFIYPSITCNRGKMQSAQQSHFKNQTFQILK